MSQNGEWVKGHRSASWSGVTAPMEGGIGISFTVNEERIRLFLTCTDARNFCDALHDSLLYYEQQGNRPFYTYTDRQKSADIELPAVV